MLAAGDTAGVVNLWAPGIPKRYGLMLLTGHQGAAGSIEFSDDEDHVLTGSRDGTVRIWTISAEALITRIRSFTSVCVPASVRMERLSESGRSAATRYQACRATQVGAAAK